MIKDICKKYLLWLFFIITWGYVGASDVEAGYVFNGIQAIKDKGSITVAVRSRDNVPFVMRDEQGALFGFDIELVDAIAKKLEVDIEYIEVDQVGDMIDLLHNGMVDIAISRLSRTLKRAEKISFSEPYLRIPLQVLVDRLLITKHKREHSFIDILNHSHIVVGTLINTSYVEVINNHLPHAQLKEYRYIKDIFYALEIGEINVVLLDSLFINYMLSTFPAIAIRAQAVNLDYLVDNIVIGVDPRELHLLMWINYFIADAKENGLIKKLQRKYI